ncbi:hypothetical protein K443DRAFT_171310 [Laccaria amethystina LaAM-08-1]|uniref:Unplaced genomic scaffold K443scaffold_110, whole genome shotgun sequence n=1 Tax=Laccaria amethystina LaAM-08-1 TaxID=1095629 RepID=A0A0C9WP18_9AGAR|nr:hypothetical protein K443DRAFT_171310 [Laccaria amethystina LaAM-08-1]
MPSVFDEKRRRNTYLTIDWLINMNTSVSRAPRSLSCYGEFTNRAWTEAREGPMLPADLSLQVWTCLISFRTCIQRACDPCYARASMLFFINVSYSNCIL